MKNILPLLGLCCLSFLGKTQVLDFTDFQKQVLANQPASLRADLNLTQASAILLQAKGGFDPKAYANHFGKNYQGKTYFQYTELGVKVPTWAGLELKGAYNRAAGEYLNPEKKLPQNGQASLGLQWSLGQGLFFDERRAGLQMARVGLELGNAERLAARNDLLLEAAKGYWNWVYTSNALEIVDNALRQAQIRHAGLRESFLQGDKPAIDTLETFIQVQMRLLDVQTARTEAQNAAYALTFFLWNPENQAIAASELPPAPSLLFTINSEDMAPGAEALLQSENFQHPELQVYQAKLRQLAVERRLKNEKRKPVLDASYYLLGNGWQFFPTAGLEGPTMLANDVKWGLEFSYPILNRKARGDWQLTQIKIAQTQLELRDKQQAIATKMRQYANDLQNLRAQVLLFKDVTANYQRLLEAENEKFSLGESSIFLINAREQRWLDAQLKYMKLISELRKAESGFQWASGKLGKIE